MKENIRKFIDGNTNNRFLIFSHNYEIAYNLNKLLKDIYDSKSPKTICDSKSTKPKDFKYVVGNFELKNFQISETDLNNGHNQYAFLISNIYKYANGKQSDITDLTIGNCLRKALEKFSSFMYNQGMERLWTHLNEDNKYLSNYLYRILLNNESHTKISAYDLDEFDSFEKYTPEEKINMAKYCLAIINVLNELHLQSYLSEDEIKSIKEWSKNWKNKK